MIRIVSYGDSWTIGEGCDREVEIRLSDHEKFIYQKENSWVRFLSDRLNIPYSNRAISGNSNNKIFNKIIDDVRNGETTKYDLVTIMWSSSLRDDLPFFPNGDSNKWISWSTMNLSESPEKFYKSTKTENEFYDSFIEYYKRFYLTELYDEKYYFLLNQNYIILLQSFLKYYNIRYIMIDGIENMFLGNSKELDKSHLIDKSYYWNCGKETARQFLTKLDREDIWEHKDRWKEIASQHPNKLGYKILSDEFYDFIKIRFDGYGW